ncbi:hypothetical protein JCGZ_12241 [Jatropha curcas]|uniref:Phospholipase A1 n=2 Tax=Jatropha curcas TaxID=180498 RepID=A0A067KHQ6_JATCU|nr:hypothetical protein JCGZ_12241 [Jatropha curcas]
MDLRRYLIHYGEMAQATYDNFISDVRSDYAGDYRYPMKKMFSGVDLNIANPFKYRAVKYVYATSKVELPQSFMVKSLAKQPWSSQCNWIGYVAVATDEGKAMLGRRDIVIAWRGTIQPIEWVKDFQAPLISASNILKWDKDPRVHQGFLSLYNTADFVSAYSKTSAREQVIEEVKRLMQEFKHEETSLTVTGHSLGAALATLNAIDIAANGFNIGDESKERSPVTAFVFASPRVGDRNFKELSESVENLHILKIKNLNDLVPLTPPKESGYADVGKELLLNTLISPFVNRPGGPLSWHNLEAYLHGVAGTQGDKPVFHLEVKRDIALLNKEISNLQPDYLIPPAWRCPRNTGMVKMKDGSWELRDQENEEDD